MRLHQRLTFRRLSTTAARRPLLPFFLVLCALVLIPSRAGLAQQRADTVLEARDVLNIVVWNEADLSGKFSIGEDGTFTFPFVGRVKAAGLHLREIEDTLRRGLSDGFFKEPQLSVAVERPATQMVNVNVMGEVRQAGSYPAAANTTLIEMLARAGSTTDRAGGFVLISRPHTDPGTSSPQDVDVRHPLEVVRVNLKSLQSGAAAENIVVRGGDTIFVPRAESIYVMGAVKSPGAYPLQEQTTVLQALALAGGLTDRGSFRTVRVVRQVDRSKQTIKIKLHELLQPGDTIVVGERLF